MNISLTKYAHKYIKVTLKVNEIFDLDRNKNFCKKYDQVNVKQGIKIILLRKIIKWHISALMNIFII